MQRAIQTAIHMFESHQNKDKIIFVALPMVHELLHISSDIPADINIVLEKYAPGQPICKGLVFDFSLILSCGIPQLWNPLTLTNHQRLSLLLAELGDDFTYEQYRDSLLKLLDQFPHSFESGRDIFNRAQNFKKFIKEYLNSNPLP